MMSGQPHPDPKGLKCHQALRMLDAYIEDRLEDAQAMALAAHLEHCASCSAALRWSMPGAGKAPSWQDAFAVADRLLDRTQATPLTAVDDLHRHQRAQHKALVGMIPAWIAADGSFDLAAAASNTSDHVLHLPQGKVHLTARLERDDGADGDGVLTVRWRAAFRPAQGWTLSFLSLDSGALLFELWRPQAAIEPVTLAVEDLGFDPMEVPVRIVLHPGRHRPVEDT